MVKLSPGHLPFVEEVETRMRPVGEEMVQAGGSVSDQKMNQALVC